MVHELLVGDEQTTWKELTADPKSQGHAILTSGGEPVVENGVSDMAVPVAANMFDISNQIGDILGESAGCKRFCVIGAGRNYVGVNFENASGLVIQSTAAKAKIKELRDVR